MDNVIALTASGIASGAVLAIAALGFLVLHNATGVVNFAHGDLITLGAYLGVWATTDLGLPVLPGYLLALLVMAAVGLLIERTAFAPLRKKPLIVVVIATLAAATVIRGLIAVWQGSTPKTLPSPAGDGALRIAGATIAHQRLLIVAVAAVAVVALLLLFGRTSFGRQVRALATDPDTARLQGVRTKAIGMAAFVISSVLAGLAGLLVAPLGAVDLNLGFGLMITAFAAAVLGGFGSLTGVVLGALAIGLIEQLVGGLLFPSYSTMLAPIVLFLVIVFRPQGLVNVTRSRL
ncbi:branched-chain amino acid ABC transporter permease [Dactylosporangium sp. NPDC005572]|uniref:branched-chain amino acid ABC transporter permease n=1 Tax=Dactylosporangium sp. NPDC005572 TaxID=3156889 RepID=UPI0033B0E4A5